MVTINSINDQTCLSDLFAAFKERKTYRENFPTIKKFVQPRQILSQNLYSQMQPEALKFTLSLTVGGNIDASGRGCSTGAHNPEWQEQPSRTDLSPPMRPRKNRMGTVKLDPISGLGGWVKIFSVASQPRLSSQVTCPNKHIRKCSRQQCTRQMHKRKLMQNST